MLDKIKVVIALGYFDSVHKAHRTVIKRAIDLALELGAEPCVFSFDGNLRGVQNSFGKALYTTSERRKLFYDMGIKETFFAPITKSFLELDSKEFLDYINSLYDIKGYVCGENYRFGNGGKGDTSFLLDYAKRHNQKLCVISLINDGETKISTTLIKELLKSGKIKKANELLEENYSITGEVFRDRKIGTKIGFPTINISIPADKFKIKDGVYSGYVVIENKKYNCIINYGARPTFNLQTKLLEAHIIDYDGNLYGKVVTVYFNDYMRDIKKFDTIVELQQQLKIDREKIKND